MNSLLGTIAGDERLILQEGQNGRGTQDCPLVGSLGR